MRHSERFDEIRALTTSTTRRELIKRSVILGASVPALGSLLASCGAENVESDTEETAPPAAAGDSTPTAATGDEATPAPDYTVPPAADSTPGTATGDEEAPGEGRPGGSLVISFPDAPALIDPARTVARPEYLITTSLYNNLVTVDPELMLQPSLARSWEISDDGLVYTFELESDVTFHHGKAFTSEDVAYTFNRLLDEATGSPGRSLFALVESIETPSDQSIIFTLASPYADFPTAFGSTFGRILPSDVPADQLNSDPQGTGPFKMQTYEPGGRTVMVKNEDYWEEGLPYLDEVVEVQIPEASSQVAAITGGEIHIIQSISPTSFSTLQDSADVTVLEIPGPGFQPIVMRCDIPPFDKVEVRQALKYSIDRDDMLQAVLQGHGTLGNDHHVPPTSPFWVDTGMKERDVARARELLTQAGYPDGLDLELITSNEREGLPEQATVVTEQAAEAGFRIQINIIPWNILLGEHEGVSPFYISNWGGRPSIDETLYPYLHSTGSWNEYHYSNPDVDRLLEEGREETDTEQRMEIYAELQRIVSEDGPAVIAYHKSHITAHRNEVKDYYAHPVGWVDCTRVWLDT